MNTDKSQNKFQGRSLTQSLLLLAKLKEKLSLRAASQSGGHLAKSGNPVPVCHEESVAVDAQAVIADASQHQADLDKAELQDRVEILIACLERIGV